MEQHNWMQRPSGLCWWTWKDLLTIETTLYRLPLKGTLIRVRVICEMECA